MAALLALLNLLMLPFVLALGFLSLPLAFVFAPLLRHWHGQMLVRRAARVLGFLWPLTLVVIAWLRIEQHVFRWRWLLVPGVLYALSVHLLSMHFKSMDIALGWGVPSYEGIDPFEVASKADVKAAFVAHATLPLPR